MQTSLEKFFLKSWWVILFTILCLALLEQSLQKRDSSYSKLSLQLQELQAEKEIALAENAELLLRVNSQSDVAWIELALIRGLGMVPEGHSKVFFSNSASGK